MVSWPFIPMALEAATESKGSSATSSTAQLDITSHLSVSVHSVSPPRLTVPNELGFDATLDWELHKPSQDENIMVYMYGKEGDGIVDALDESLDELDNETFGGDAIALCEYIIITCIIGGRMIRCDVL